MVQRKHLAAIFVAALTLTAGCAGIPGLENGTDTPTPTNTDTPTPTNTDTPTPETGTENRTGVDDFNYPEWAGTSSLEGSSLQGKSSETINSASSVTISSNNTISNTDEPSSEVTIAKYGADGRVSIDSEYKQGETEEYSQNGASSIIRSTSGSDTRYYESEPSSRQQNLNLFILSKIVSNSNVTATEVIEMNGQEVVHYELSNFDTNSIADVVFADSVSDVSANLYMDDSGVVHKYQYSYTQTKGGERLTTTKSVTVSGIGNTTVEEPAWYSNNQDKVLRFNTSFSDEYIQMKMANGEGLPANSIFVVATPTGEAEIKLSESLETGDTLYVSQKDGELTISRETPSGDTTSPEQVLVISHSPNNFIQYQNLLSDSGN